MTDILTKDPEPDFVVEVGVFNVQIGVFHDENDRYAWMKTKKKEPQPPNLAAYGVVVWDEDEDGVRWWAVTLLEEANENTIVHESVHLADFIMDTHGVPTDVENTEVRAYLTADIFDALVRGRAL